MNADGYVNANGDLLGFNMYAYCGNNPVMYVDPTGEFAISLLIVGIIIGVTVGFGATVAADYVDDGEVFNGSIDTEEYVANTLIGGLVGAIAAPAMPHIAGFMGQSFTLGTPVMLGNGMVGMAGAITVTGAQIVAGGVAAGLSTHVLLSKPDSGPLRFSDGTGMDPETNKPVKTKERAEELYKKLKDPKAKANWRKWMKGKGFRTNHLK